MHLSFGLRTILKKNWVFYHVEVSDRGDDLQLLPLSSIHYILQDERYTGTDILVKQLAELFLVSFTREIVYPALPVGYVAQVLWTTYTMPHRDTLAGLAYWRSPTCMDHCKLLIITCTDSNTLQITWQGPLNAHKMTTSMLWTYTFEEPTFLHQKLTIECNQTPHWPTSTSSAQCFCSLILSPLSATCCHPWQSSCSPPTVCPHLHQTKCTCAHSCLLACWPHGRCLREGHQSSLVWWDCGRFWVQCEQFCCQT